MAFKNSSLVPELIFRVQQHQNQIKSTQQRTRDTDVHVQRQGLVVTTFHVGGRDDFASSIQFADDTSL